jgi:hypothetical protein
LKGPQRKRRLIGSIRAVKLGSKNAGENAMSDHRKRPRDPSQLAKLIVDIAAGEIEDRKPTPAEEGKNPAAVALGRLGGLKGGVARAAKLTVKEKTAIARKAATARWKKNRD